MMSLKELAEFIIKSLIKNSNNLVVTEQELEDGTIEINIQVNEEDLKRIIGKDGRTIQSIRTLIQEASTLRDNKYIKVEVNKI